MLENLILTNQVFKTNVNPGLNDFISTTPIHAQGRKESMVFISSNRTHGYAGIF